MIQELLLTAIRHERMLKKLNELNQYFYNRKHEGPIRDELVIILNECTELIAVSEYPKCGLGAVDLSLIDPNITNFDNNYLNVKAAIELKHHYPKDLRLPIIHNAIIKDMTRVIEIETTHFIHIIQQRVILSNPFPKEIKYMEHNVDDINPYVKLLENAPGFPKQFVKKSVSLTVSADVKSIYTFDIYEL